MTSLDISSIKDFPTNGKIQIINKNIYVVARNYIWDREKKTTKEVRETLGKIVDNKYYPMEEYHRLFDRKGNPRKLKNDNELNQQQIKDLITKILPNIETGRVGCIPILYSIAYKIGIWDDLVSVYDLTTSQQILALSIYFISSHENTISNYSNWSLNHLLPKLTTLSADEIIKLYEQIGSDQKKLEKYQFARIERSKTSNLISNIDSTTELSCKTYFDFYRSKGDLEYIFDSDQQNYNTADHSSILQSKLLINSVALSILEDLKLELGKKRTVRSENNKDRDQPSSNDQFIVEDVKSIMERIEYRKYGEILVYTPITNQQHLISSACGFPDLYKGDVFKFKN